MPTERIRSQGLPYSSKRFRCGLLGGILLVCSSCSTTVGLYTAAPQQLEGVTSEMRRPGFWISRIAEPDEVVLDSRTINELNRTIVEVQKTRRDLFQLSEIRTTETLIKRFTNLITSLETKALFDKTTKRVSPDFWKTMQLRLALDRLSTANPSPTPRWALSIRFTNQRVLPTDENLNEEAGDVEFDTLQNSGFDVGTPFRVLHESDDGQWVFAEAEQSDGWVKTSDLAFGSLEEIQAAVQRPFGIVVSARSDLYSEAGRKTFVTAVRMGTRLPLVQAGPDVTSLRLPARDAQGRLLWISAWAATPDIASQYLPYTRRTAIEQAFKLLNSPYGWGDQFEEQDCSSFIRMIFETMGVHLPRNSSAQGRSGASIASFGKETTRTDRLIQIAGAPAGSTLLQLGGHILLYLGQYNGKPWAISEIWAYRDDASTGSRIRVINRAVVSSLELGLGSQSGSLLERLINVTEVALPKTVPSKN